MTLAAGTPIGKYVVRRKIAEGGMAELYLCSSCGPGGFEKEVVIKRIRPFLSSDPEFVRMFVAEARLASRLNHANLVQIFDFDKHQNTYYLAMEYVRGQSLSDVRKRSKELMIAMRPTLVAHIGAEVARGLHCAHQLAENGRPLGLVHRDVTPHNVLLSFDGAVKLTDFGIAKANNMATCPGTLKGKFGYMSPEQSRGEAVDARTDVFALGIVLWEMLTGGKLFEADSDAGMIRAVQESAIASPARLNPTVPPDLDAAVMRALERDPKQRHQAAQELERALAECVLRHARTLDDTDVAAFLRALFPPVAANQSADGAQSLVKTVVPVAPVSLPERLIRPAAETSGAETRLLKTDLATWRDGDNAKSVRERPLWLSRARASPLRISSPTWVGLVAFLLVGTAVALVGARSARDLGPRSDNAIEVPSAAVPASSPAGHEEPGARQNLPQSPPQNSEAEPAAVQAKLRSHPVTGTLVLMVTPWANLAIDGRSRGEVSGLHQYQLTVGRHRVRLTHPKGARERWITVHANQQVAQEHHMLPR